MPSVEFENVVAFHQRFQVADWKPVKKQRIVVALIEEVAGGYSVVCLNLPGAASQGESREEAIANVVDAARGCIEEYEASNEQIPWSDYTADDVPHGAIILAINL
jgi:predicted RNase H-like HicB family nuclease